MIRRSLISLSLVLALAACGGSDAPEQPAEEPKQEAESPSPVTIASASASFDEANGSYTINWTADPEGAPISVLVSSHPDGKDAQLVSDNIEATNFTWTPDGSERDRRYFIIQPEAGEAELVATRLLPLEGGRNFRDLGGYKTADGREVKWGKIYRSGVMHGLTDADYDYLSDLGIKVICDFRESDEREREPTRWQAGEIDYLTFTDPDQNDVTNQNESPMFAALMSQDSTPEDVAQGMADSYFDLAMNEREGYTAMFDRLAAGEIPLAFNCSAGKDRAGTAAALILTSLGVPRETVVYDYSLSDKFVDYMEEFAGDQARADAANDPENPYAFLMQLPPEKVAPLMASDPRYIEASFSEMEARYGSVMGFIQTELDVTEDELTSIRNSLLE